MIEIDIGNTPARISLTAERDEGILAPSGVLFSTRAEPPGNAYAMVGGDYHMKVSPLVFATLLNSLDFQCPHRLTASFADWNADLPTPALRFALGPTGACPD